MASFTCLIQHSPWQGQHSYSAYQFCKAAIAQGHQIRQVFFYGDGVAHGHSATHISGDELNMQQRWLELGQQHQVPLVVCATVAARHGLDEAHSGALAVGFHAGGLAEYTEAVVLSDRLVQF